MAYLLFSVKDPEALLASSPLKRREERELDGRRTLLAQLESSVLTEFTRQELGWVNFAQVHLQLFREGLDWTEGKSDPYYQANTFLTHSFPDLILRAIQVAYTEVRAPFRAAFIDKISRGESRLSNQSLSSVLWAKLTEEEARECGLLIPPHDEVRIALKWILPAKYCSLKAAPSYVDTIWDRLRKS